MTPSALARLAAVLGFLLGFPCGLAAALQPIRAHPQNPYVLEFRGQPTLLRTYADSYSYVVDTGVPFIPYLDVLKRDGMNLTRVWCLGFPPDAPSTAARFLQPWPRVTTQGNATDGLGKWDFSAWNESYFDRIKAFAQAASDRGIVVEFTMFSVYYDDATWQAGPFYYQNNIQGYGTNRDNVLRPANANFYAAQQAAVRRIVHELNGFDNVYFEIVNEPFWNDPAVSDTQEVNFHNGMLAAIRNEESLLPNRHLVAHNFPQNLASLSPDFDMLNEHYPAVVPTTDIAGAEALLENQYFRGKILSLDETDTDTAIQTRLEAWMFLIGGGGIYDGLDAGDVVYNSTDYSGDNALGSSMRQAVRNIGTYMDRLNLVALRRNSAWVSGGSHPAASFQASASPGQQYVAYFYHGRGGVQDFQLHYDPIDTGNHTASVRVTLEPGTWRAVWTRPIDMVDIQTQSFTYTSGQFTLAPITYQADVALRIERTGAADATPPPRVTGLAAVSTVDGPINLSWNAVQAYDLASYRLYRSESPGVPLDAAHLAATVPAGTTAFTDNTMLGGTTYYYVMAAVDQTGNPSSVSNEAGAAAVLVIPNLQISGYTGSQVTFGWITALPGWYLQASPDLSTGSWLYSAITPTVTGNQYQVTVTLTGQPRYFRLIHQAPPDPVLRISDNGLGQLVLKWQAVPAGWFLQESADLAPESWVNSSLTATVVDDQNQITFTPALERRFFRLIRP